MRNIKKNLFSNPSGQKGITLVELMIAMLISGIVISAIYAAFRSQQRSYLAQEQVSEMQQNIRAGVGMMVREIRLAGYAPDGSQGAGIITANASSFGFTFVADNDGTDNDNDNATDESGELATVKYYLYDGFGDGDIDLGRQVETSLRTVAENIERLEFYYIMNSGNQTLTPTDLDDIHGVEISVLARANKPDRTFSNTATYTTPSGANWPVNDHFRRRFHTVTVQCRNM